MRPLTKWELLLEFIKAFAIAGLVCTACVIYANLATIYMVTYHYKPIC